MKYDKCAADFEHHPMVSIELEYPSCKHIKYHQFMLPCGLYEGTKQVQAFNTFFHNHKKSYFKTPGRIFSEQDYVLFWLTRKESPHTKFMYEVDWRYHEDIWTYFEYIGFDYKAKKWTKAYV